MPGATIGRGRHQPSATKTHNAHAKKRAPPEKPGGGTWRRSNRDPSTPAPLAENSLLRRRAGRWVAGFYAGVYELIFRGPIRLELGNGFGDDCGATSGRAQRTGFQVSHFEKPVRGALARRLEEGAWWAAEGKCTGKRQARAIGESGQHSPIVSGLPHGRDLLDRDDQRSRLAPTPRRRSISRRYAPFQTFRSLVGYPPDVDSDPRAIHLRTPSGRQAGLSEPVHDLPVFPPCVAPLRIFHVF